MTIYFDLDGVLADFETHAKALTGRSWAIEDKTKWAVLNGFPTFFSSMPWVEGSRELWEFALQYEPHVLSASSKSMPGCVEQKREWCIRELNLPLSRIHVVGRKREKAAFARPGDILIDDYRKNIEEWEAASGHGILFINPNQSRQDLIAAIEVAK